MENPDSLKLKKIQNKALFSVNNRKNASHTPYSEAVSEMENAVWDLCDRLDHPADAVEMDCQEWIDALEKYIVAHSNRLYYSTISNYVFQMDEQQFTEFLSNLGKIVDYAEPYHGDKDGKKRNLYRTIIKFYDHANLAHQQQVTFSSKQDSLREDVKREVTATLEPKISDITKDMTSQLVGLIGIFTALSFIVFGGISSLDSIFGAVQGALETQDSVLPLLLIAIAWALCMMNLLFGFMYFVIRITHLPKPVDKDATNVVQRYPTVFLCNYILLALLVLLGGMWFAEKNGIGKNVFDFAVKDHSTGTFWGFWLLFVAFFVALGVILWMQYTKKDKPTETKQARPEGKGDKATPKQG